jgi:hypothetical protein
MGYFKLEVSLHLVLRISYLVLPDQLLHKYGNKIYAVTPTIALIASRLSSLSALTLKSNPSSAFLEMRIAISKIGIITGKLKIAISVALFPALEAIPLTMVKLAEKPTEPRIKFNRNKP